MDLVKAFHEILIYLDDTPKTTIITSFDLFEDVNMSFWIKHAAQAFQRFNDEVIRDLPFCFAYIDDLFMASPDETSHRKHLYLS